MALDKLKEKSEPATKEAEQEKPARKEQEYQVYHCSRKSTRMVTTNGRPVVFANNEFITSDKEVIEYLDKELKDPRLGITKGEKISSAEIDPMERARRKVIEEAIASGEVVANSGSSFSQQGGVKPLTSADVTTAAGSS